MKITAIHHRSRLRILELTIEDGRVWGMPYTDLFDVGIGLEAILAEYGVGSIVPKAGPLKAGWREALQISSMRIQDLESWKARDVVERNLEAAHTVGRPRHWHAGGAWYAEIVVNDIPTDCCFNTVEEFFQIVYQIIRRETDLMIGMERVTVPGLVGNG